MALGLGSLAFLASLPGANPGDLGWWWGYRCPVPIPDQTMDGLTDWQAGEGTTKAFSPFPLISDAEQIGWDCLIAPHLLGMIIICQIINDVYIIHMWEQTLVLQLLPTTPPAV